MIDKNSSEFLRAKADVMSVELTRLREDFAEALADNRLMGAKMKEMSAMHESMLKLAADKEQRIHILETELVLAEERAKKVDGDLTQAPGDGTVGDPQDEA